MFIIHPSHENATSVIVTTVRSQVSGFLSRPSHIVTSSEFPLQSNALRVLLCFTEKTHKHRMMGRKKDVEISGMKVESLDELPAELLEISDEDARALADLEMADEVGEEEVMEGVEDDDEHEETGAENEDTVNGHDEALDDDKREEEGQDTKGSPFPLTGIAQM